MLDIVTRITAVGLRKYRYRMDFLPLNSSVDDDQDGKKNVLGKRAFSHSNQPRHLENISLNKFSVIYFEISRSLDCYKHDGKSQNENIGERNICLCVVCW